MQPLNPPICRRWSIRIALVACVVTLALIAALCWFLPAPGLAQQLQSGLADMLAWNARSPVQATLAFSLVFALMSALAVPGCAVLALAAGALFGAWWGTVLVAVASAAGALLSFAVARRYLREPLRHRYGAKLRAIDAGLQRDGALYLFSLRMAPVVPYALLNPLMGLTAMPAWPFFWVSAAGMLAGSAVYAFAGAAMMDWRAQQATSAAGDVASLVMAWQPPYGMVAFAAALALLPWAWRWWQPLRSQRDPEGRS